MMKLLLILILTVAGAHCLAPLIEGEGGYPGQYIVKVRSSILVEKFRRQVEKLSAEVLLRTSGQFGDYEIEFALKVNPSVLFMRMDRIMVDLVRAISFVGYIEEDDYNYFDDVGKAQTLAMPPARWGLDRINQATSELDNDISFNGDGTGVNIYVIDSGINHKHEDFGGRAKKVFDVFGAKGNDCGKHGTSVAGVAASKTYGVARNATIHSVRMLDCVCGAGTSHMAKAIDWVAENAILPCVATMAFSRRTSSPTINDAVERLAAKGCIPIAAATNVKKGNNYDACSQSPADSPHAITVAATTWRGDQRAGFSRYGMCVDIFAPGDFIYTTAANGKYEWRSGTSLSVPFTAGVAAIHLGNGVPPEEVKARILGDALSCQLPDPGRGSPNRLLYIEPAPKPVVEEPPVESTEKAPVESTEKPAIESTEKTPVGHQTDSSSTSLIH